MLHSGESSFGMPLPSGATAHSAERGQRGMQHWRCTDTSSMLCCGLLPVSDTVLWPVLGGHGMLM